MKVTIKRTVSESVEILSLEKKDLMLIKKDILCDQIVEDAETIRLLRQPSAGADSLFDDADDERDLDAEVAEAFAEDAAKHKNYSHAGNGGATLGQKQGSSSNYHYVYWDDTKKKFVGTVNGKYIYSNNSEVKVAMAVDTYLDEIGDPDRPRNYDEFPETVQIVVFESIEDAMNPGGTS